MHRQTHIEPETHMDNVRGSERGPSPPPRVYFENREHSVLEWYTGIKTDWLLSSM